MKRRLDVVLALLAFAALAAWIGWRASVALDLDLRVATDDGVSSSPAIDETARGSNAAARELDPLVDDSTRADSALAFDPGAARTPVALEPAGVVWRESEIVTCAVDELGRGIDGVSIEFHSYPPGFESQLHDWGHFEDVDLESPRAPRVTPAFLGERTVQAPDANSSAATDDDSTGCFSVTWFLAAGTEFRTTATLRALGFEPRDVEIAMLAGEVQRATYVLTRTRPEIGGHVVDERGTPLSEIVLELHGDPTLARERVTSDAHGAFEFPLTRRSEARALLVFRGKNVVATLAPE
ncbi:MAG: hypothetical protein L6Q99_00630 [Planctomycetes bacterium]|nr:hypothetical protein [Planctomycetota bacterium]